MSIFPKQINLSNKKDSLIIKWNDNSVQTLSLLKLRKLCPCAFCLADKEKQSSSYIPIFLKNQIEISSINQVGNYAITIVWKDGHNTGIYEFPFLKILAENSD